jgi:energy-coupling factor transport system ATP-binding protein
VIALDAGRIIYDGPSAAWGAAASESRSVFSIPTAALDASMIVRASNLRQRDSPLWPMPAHPLDRITLEVRAGEAIGLCGPIGAGKTTLALHLAGLFERWEGDLSWPGIPSRERPVMLIQFPERQLFCATVLEDVKVGPKARGVAPKALADVACATLDRVGLPPAAFGSRSPFDLSGGQKRRAALAGIAAVPSGLYLLDEPQAALDGDGLLRLESLLRDWVSQGSAYVIISHDLDFLRRLTHRVWVMDKGRLIFDGPWETLDSRPEVLKSIGFTATAGRPAATLPDLMTEGPSQSPP